VRKHDLKEGDSIDLIEDEAGTVRLVTRQHWVDQVERLRRPLPEDWKDWKSVRDSHGMRAIERMDEELADLRARKAAAGSAKDLPE
jgi:hypothetical protein